ncbi:MAG: hypothetical protein MJ188_03840 [Treponema sp.]|nr:hypothetical protein [Treponema sp.]
MLKMIGKKLAIKQAVFFIFCFLNSLLFAEGRQITFGGKAGWPVFDSAHNVTIGKGRYGYDCVELATNSFGVDEYTDLLVNFEDSQKIVAAGNYDIVYNHLKTTTEAVMDKSAGLSRNLGGICLLGNKGSFFGTEGLQGSFSIEFWLSPSIAENGETIINWESSKNVRGRLIYQLMNCVFENGHLNWTLSNFFDDYKNENGEGEVYLEGTSYIVPDKWSYHTLSYDCETGILEYIVNGITEDIKYITSTGTEDGDIYLVVLGAPSELEFCSEYTGKIDDIRILTRAFQVPDYQSAKMAGKPGRMIYRPEGGRFKTKPFMVSTGSQLSGFDVEKNTPSQTDVCFFIRSGDNFFNWSDSYPEWKPVDDYEPIPQVSGLYYQIACDFYTNGDGSETPSVTSITLDFTEIPQPLPPFSLKAVAGNGCVKLNWNYSVDSTTGGYYIYYGSRPGEYLGSIAIEGASPVNVGNTTNYTLTGLENGRIYYFAVASWSSLDDRIVGQLSQEVFARPLERLK